MMTTNKKKFKKFITEKQEQDCCLALLRRVGIIAFRHNTGAMLVPKKDGTHRYVRFNDPGYPDIGGYDKNGTAFYWEVKRHGGKATTAQKEYIDRALKHNCIAGIGTCEDLEKMLQGLGYVR